MKLNQIPLTGAALLLSLTIPVLHAQKAGGPEIFPSADAAAQALLTANEQNNVAALNKILGPDAAEIISSGDGVQDSRRRERFVARAKDGFKVIPDPADIRHYLI